MIDREELDLFARSVRAAAERSTGGSLDAALADLGWHDAFHVDDRAAVSILFEAQGWSTATSSALGAVLSDALGVQADGVVLPVLGSWSPPAIIDRDRLRIDGLLLGEPSAVVVVAGETAAVVAVDRLEVGPPGALDPSSGVRRVHGQVAADERVRVDWSQSVAAGQRALGHELVGLSRRMLEHARVHALERVQFGRPIAQFQAVRHRLADTLVAIESADALLDAAWQDRTPVTAAMAKGLAGRSARTAARHCQQVLAGIGFTTEHPLQQSIKRTLVLDQLLGSSVTLTKALGRELVDTRALPPLVPL